MYTLVGRNQVQILRLTYDPTKVNILDCFMYVPFQDTLNHYLSLP